MPESPSTLVTSDIVTVGKSSFVIVPTPCGTIMLHPTQFDKLTLNVSSSSSVESVTTGTVIVFRVSLDPKFSVLNVCAV